MSYTYLRLETIFARRRGDTKSFLRDCILTKDPETQDFVVTFKRFRSWLHDEKTKKYTRINDLEPMARINKDNVTTLLYKPEPCMTACNRLTALAGRPVIRNKRQYANYEHHIRLYERGYYGNQGSVPYFPGIQIKDGKVLNPIPDVKRVVAQTSINAAKNKFNTLRKLALVMAKMGSLRDLALQAAESYRYELGRNWKIDPEIASIADKFNFEEPTFKDVELLFKYGACQCERPNRHHYSNGQWVPLSTDEYAYDYARRAVEYGLRALRKHFHENNDGYDRITT